LFAGSSAVIATASIAPRVPSAHLRLAPAAVLAIGLGGVTAAALAAGRPVPAPLGAATIPLGVLAAIAEEALFRRAAYGALLLFALVHLPAYGVAAFPVDLGAGLLFGWQRWASGTWGVPAATHAAANLLAVVR
jgi:membrane protease YdiL (CAAX protease family)